MMVEQLSDVMDVRREELFDFIADFNNCFNIDPSAVSVNLKKSDYGETVLEVTKRDGERYTIVQRARRPDILVREIRERTTEGRATYTLDAVLGGTLVSLSFIMKSKGRFGFLAPVVKGSVAERIRASFCYPLRKAQSQFKIEQSKIPRST